MERKEVLLSIPKTEKFYMVHSDFTRLPFIYCDDESFDDATYLFETKEKAEKKQSELLETKQKTTVVEMDQENLLKTFTQLIVAGVNAIKYNYKDDDYMIQLNEIVKVSDFSELPPEQRPLENRTLQLTMTYFCQEIRANLDNPNTPVIKDLEEEMMVNMLKSKFYIPVREAQEDGKPQVQMLMLKINEGASMIPIFTDNIEFNKMPNDESVKRIIMDTKNLVNFAIPTGCDGFLINPMGVSLPLNQGVLNTLKNMEVAPANEDNTQ